MTYEQISIRNPVATFRAKEAAPIFNLNRPIKGLKVGIRNDPFWRSWLQITDVWCELLVKDGAVPVIMRIGEHVGEEGKKTKEAVTAWANEVDCAVVGLAN